MCTATILVSAALADIALQCCLNCAGIVLGKLKDGAVTLVIVLREGTCQDSAYLYRNARIPLLGHWRLLFQMGVPHLLNKFVGKRWTTCQQFIDTDGECVLVGVASWIALPLLRWHIGGCARNLAERCMCLHAKIERCAEISEQDLPTTSKQQVARFNILVNETVLMEVKERRCCLLEIWHKLLCIGKSPGAVFSAKKVMNGLRRILYHQVRATIL